MSDAKKQERCRIGFLTVVEIPEMGFVGGLLVTNQLGRPLEFQCTTPVRPNRTQEILYGPTLKPFVYAELIGRTLIDRADVAPELVLIRDQRLEDLANHIKMPVGRLLPDASDGDGAQDLGANTVIGCPSSAASMDSVSKMLDSFSSFVPDSANLNEPFDRILEALQETMRTAA